MPIGHTGRVDLPLAVRSVQRKGRRCRPNYSTTCRLFEPGCRDVFSRCLLYILYLSIAYRDCEVSIAGEDLAVATRTRARGGAAAARGARAGRRRAAAALAVAARATRRAGKKYDTNSYIYFKITFQPARSTSHVTAARPESSSARCAAHFRAPRQPSSTCSPARGFVTTAVSGAAVRRRGLAWPWARVAARRACG